MSDIESVPPYKVYRVEEVPLEAVWKGKIHRRLFEGCIDLGSAV